MTGRQGFTDLAAVAAAWYFGNNAAGVPMYDPATGRTFDGVAADGTINRNSGAESTIHGLLFMLALDGRPVLAARASAAATPQERVTWQLLEAEDGRLAGDATIVGPEAPWTGESLWSGSSYVALGSGGHVEVDAQLPVTDRYHVLPVFWRQPTPLREVGTRHRVAKQAAGTQWQGGAGPQGVTPEPGFLDVGQTATATRRPVSAGTVGVTSAYTGGGTPARLDALLLPPEVEWMRLSGDAGGQGLLRSFARAWQSRTVTVPGADRLIARAYDQRGRLRRTVHGSHGTVRAPVAPGGFTYLDG